MNVAYKFLIKNMNRKDNLMTSRLFLIGLFLLSYNSIAQSDPKWDDTKAKDWPIECKKIDIISSLDGKMQNAYYYKSHGNKLRPLIISLHTWSSGYKQKDSLSWQCIERNYIHPDFRGPNTKFNCNL